MITPNDIKDRILSTASHGYNVDETNAFLDEIAESYSAIYAENKELYRKMEILASKIEEYREEEDSIKSTLITAQKAADQLTKGTKEKAEALLTESANKAQQTVIDAKEKAESLVSEARDFVAGLTKEKKDEADLLLADAQKKADDAIHNAKAVAGDLLAQAKAVSEELVEKARQEKEYHENLVSKLKEESAAFKNSLVALYQAQLDKLQEMMQAPVDAEKEAAAEKLQGIEDELHNVFTTVNQMNEEIKLSEPEEQAEEEAEEEEAFAKQQEEPVMEFEDISSGADVLEDEYEEVKKISVPEETEELEIIEEDASEGDVKTALDAFTKDEITPITEDAKITEINEPAELEEPEEQPFESFFNVKHEGRTKEKISLVPPEDDDDDDDLKFRGFFRKKKK